MTHRLALTLTLVAAVALVIAVVTLALPAGYAEAPPSPATIGAAPQPPAGDGSVPESAPLSPFDDGNAAVARLDPVLLAAVREAARAARRDRIELRITSGWRSADHQRQLLDDAVVRYGSERIARQYVSTPEKSAHVTGEAVDVGPTDAAYWMIQHGAEYGLCQVYANEVWHFEHLVEPGGTCPVPRADASGG